MLEWFQSQIVSLVYFVVVIALFLVAIIAGMRFSGGSKIVGWIVGILALIALVVVFGPLTDALSDKACELNYRKCE